MKIQIDTELCAKYGLTPAEFFLLLFVQNDGDIARDREALIDKGLITTGGNLMMPYELSPRGKEVSDEIVIESSTPKNNKSELETLAFNMMQLFPAGAKMKGKPWRCNLVDVTNKLKKWKLIYGTYMDNEGIRKEWTDDDILKATKLYVDSFQLDRTYMRQLKYFILKADPKRTEDGNFVERISDLAEVLTLINENEDITPSDLTIRMR